MSPDYYPHVFGEAPSQEPRKGDDRRTRYHVLISWRAFHLDPCHLTSKPLSIKAGIIHALKRPSGLYTPRSLQNSMDGRLVAVVQGDRLSVNS